MGRALPACAARPPLLTCRQQNGDATSVMIVVHHLNNSRSQRVLWLLEELGLPYEVKRYERDKATMLAPPALRAVHPLGKSPVISDGAATVAESGAIVEYLVEHHGEGRLRPPPGTAERLRERFVAPQIERHLDFLENELADRDWFAGPDFSAADVQMSFPLEAAAARAGLDARRPRLAAWLARIHARPAYQRALARGGPYELLR